MKNPRYERGIRYESVTVTPRAVEDAL